MLCTTICWLVCALAGCGTTASEVASGEKWFEVRSPRFVYAEDPVLQAKVTKMLVNISVAQSGKRGRENADGGDAEAAD